MKKTKEEIKEIVFKILGDIAPETDPARLKPDLNFRDQLDIDSIDLLNFMIALHHALKVEIPESDYPKLMTIHGAVGYLASLDEGTK